MMNNDNTGPQSDELSCCLSSGEKCPITTEQSFIYLVRFLHSSEVMLCSSETQELVPGQTVIASGRYGKDLARVMGAVSESYVQGQEAVIPIVKVASETDLAEYKKNLGFEADALATCRAQADSHALKMKVLSAHFLPAENKLLVFFTADGRVDFRELVRDLVSIFRMRIELRQIGVRDETRLLGGIGICGRVLCCHMYPSQMCSVSIKMAKEQNLSLGSMKVSGPCGRLMCCLSYEHEYYASERSNFPKPGTTVAGGSTDFVVSEVNMVSRRVVLTGATGTPVVVEVDEIDFDSAKRRWSVDLPEEHKQS